MDEQPDPPQTQPAPETPAPAPPAAAIDEVWLSELVSAFPGAQAGVKLEWDVFVLTVGGKLFGLYGELSGEPLLTLKGDPLENEALRQQFAEIIPGYHMNKRHWNSIRLATSTLPPDRIAEFVEESYSIVFASLPKYAQAEIRSASLREG